MASKPKSSGCTSERRVTDAMKKCGCEGSEFFTLAAAHTNADCDIESAWLRFEKFQKRGEPDSQYQIPAFVLSFAEVVLSPSAKVARLIGELRAITRPVEQYHAAAFSTQHMAAA